MISPLAGKRVVVTRAPHQAGALADRLRARGATPLLYPCIDIAPPEDTGPLDSALRQAARGGFDWLVLTSANAVMMLARRLEAQGISPTALNGAPVAAIGPATAEAARDWLGLAVSVMPETYIAEALAGALHLAPGARVLLPQSAIARPTLAEALTAPGADVTAVVAYRNVVGRGGVALPALLAAGEVDAVTFTSSSTAQNFLRRLADEGGASPDLAGVCVACIGPVTAQTARALGLAVAVMPAEYTLEGLMAGLERVMHFCQSAKLGA
ncbi:MAG: uroporphyrinogen-III synthase [Anaerolineae bacterium]|nr:uroporphyrinogen-III synthase [Anaerolineae bacterium]